MISKRLILTLSFFVVIFHALPINANNIKVTNVSLLNQDKTNNTTEIKFDISWENSWRTNVEPNNYDAAWLFVKFKDSSGEWKHATLSSSGSDHTPVSGTTIDAVADGKGVFIYRSNTGSGTFTSNGDRIQWNYGTDGLDDDDQVSIKVFAIEMTYIPQGSFYAGSDTSNEKDVNALMAVEKKTTTGPFLISTTLVDSIKSLGNANSDGMDDEVLQAINGNTGIGIDGDGGIDSDNDGTIDNINFPTGYNAFYLMKYEVSQQQYVDFLNTLSRTQQNNRTATQNADYYAMSNSTTVDKRNGIRVPSAPGSGVITFGCDLDGDGVFNEANDGGTIAANYLNWSDIAAYLDWAALRPYTELEFVKAARGPNTVVAGEYSWGNTTINTPGSGGLTNEGTESEVSGSSTANVHVASPSGVDGPIRVGSFAESSTTRTEAGAGYYGNLDLSGNVWEIVIPLGHSTGRSFTGKNGDGELTSDGFADVDNWPSGSPAYLGKRGAPFLGTMAEAQLANRNYGCRDLTNTRREYDGCRGARSAQ